MIIGALVSTMSESREAIQIQLALRKPGEQRRMGEITMRVKQHKYAMRTVPEMRRTVVVREQRKIMKGMGEKARTVRNAPFLT
jgi:hypothetical protein